MNQAASNGVIQIQIFNFALIYLLLLVVLFIMRKAKINEAKLLFTASLKMSVQLFLSGLLLTYIFKNPHPLFVVAYLSSMVLFSVKRIYKRNPTLNVGFKRIIILCLAGSGFSVVAFFVGLVVNTSIFNPQYAIPISGMILGNAMNGLSLGVKSLLEYMDSEHNRFESLLNAGIEPDEILKPSVNKALETALLPTLNNMLNMGIISLPGMMTGQILSGTLPVTAIMYQIAIMIAISTGVALTTFSALYLGYRTYITPRKRINFYDVPTK